MGKFWISWDGLQKYNFILFIIHLILAFALLIYFERVINPGQEPVNINLDLFNHIQMKIPDTDFFQTISQQAFAFSEKSVSNMVVSFFAITSVFHLFYALNPGNVYLDAVKNGNNYFRWLEYSITATTMILIIAILSGVKDIKNYFLLTTAAIGMISTGQWFETSKNTNAKWIPILIGFLLLGGIFTCIFTSFADGVDAAKKAGVDIPSWLWATVIVLFMFYACFGAVPVVQAIFGGKYRKYEYAYLTLSLLAKTTLGLLVGYGFGQRLN